MFFTYVVILSKFCFTYFVNGVRCYWFCDTESVLLTLEPRETDRLLVWCCFVCFCFRFVLFVTSGLCGKLLVL